MIDQAQVTDCLIIDNVEEKELDDLRAMGGDR